MSAPEVVIWAEETAEQPTGQFAATYRVSVPDAERIQAILAALAVQAKAEQ